VHLFQTVIYWYKETRDFNYWPIDKKIHTRSQVLAHTHRRTISTDTHTCVYVCVYVRVYVQCASVSMYGCVCVDVRV